MKKIVGILFLICLLTLPVSGICDEPVPTESGVTPQITESDMKRNKDTDSHVRKLIEKGVIRDNSEHSGRSNSYQKGK